MQARTQKVVAEEEKSDGTTYLKRNLCPEYMNSYTSIISQITPLKRAKDMKRHLFKDTPMAKDH